METAVKKLEVLLLKTENDVDALSAKLDHEFAALALENGVTAHASPNEILKNVRELRNELKRVSSDVEQFQKDQKEVMAEVKERLSKLSAQFEEVANVRDVALKPSEDT